MFYANTSPLISTLCVATNTVTWQVTWRWGVDHFLSTCLFSFHKVPLCYRDPTQWLPLIMLSLGHSLCQCLWCSPSGIFKYIKTSYISLASARPRAFPWSYFVMNVFKYASLSSTLCAWLFVILQNRVSIS